VFIISQFDEFLERPPHVVRDLLRDLKPTLGIDSDSLQVADHDVDDQIARQIFCGIFGKGNGQFGIPKLDLEGGKVKPRNK